MIWDGFSIFGGARTALLYGDLEQFTYYGGRQLNANEVVQTWEIQAGIEMEREYDAFDAILRVFGKPSAGTANQTCSAMSDCTASAFIPGLNTKIVKTLLCKITGM